MSANNAYSEVTEPSVTPALNTVVHNPSEQAHPGHLLCFNNSGWMEL